jgi:hypothetical protein
LTELLNNYPEAIAVVIAVTGLFAARLLAGATDRMLEWLARSLRRLAPLRLENLDFASFQPFAHGLIYYATLLLFLLVALRALNISVIGDWLDALGNFIPQLIIAALILLAGYVLGLISRSAVAGATGSRPDQLLPRLSQLLIITVALLTALGHLSINISFLANIIVLLLATSLGGLALAFALGSRQLVANVLARRSLDRYRIGRRIRIEDIEGEIIEILDTAVVVETETGITIIPAARFAETSVTLLAPGQGGSSGDGQ